MRSAFKAIGDTASAGLSGGVVIVTMMLGSLSGTARATDGYFAHGYGMKAIGRGGAAIATTDNAFGGANNPATMALAGDRLELGVELFSPRRDASRSGLGPGLDGAVDSERTLFEIPEFGYNHRVNDHLALGLTLYGNGGMNTDYPDRGFNCGRGPANILCGAGHLGVDLQQMIVAPTVAYSFAHGQAIGLAPLFAYQRFEADGLQAFAATPGVSAQPVEVTNRGHQNSIGGGARIGYYAHVNSALSLGMTYSSRIGMTRFTRYAGLFADAGALDIPSNYGVGFTWTAAPALTAMLDFNRINYSRVASIGHSSLTATQLGAPDGPGFGWRDISVWKFGLEYASSERWMWRVGYNHCDDPIDGRNVTFNILAPGVVTDHATVGMTYTLAHGELTVAYMHAFAHSVQGASILPVFLGGMPAGNERISMYQNSIGIQYAFNLGGRSVQSREGARP